MKKYLKRFMTVSAAALALLLLTAGGLEIARRSVSASLPDQLAWERWGGDSAQISVFFADGSGAEFDRMPGLERTVDEALTEASLSPAEGGRLWYHAASAESEMYGSTTRGSATLHLTVYAGDYFLIHRPNLISGSYPGSDGESAGYIFLDRNAAWQLFGATDVVGMSMNLGEGDYIVCGVGEIPDGTVYDEAYGTAPRAYVLAQSPAGKSVRRCTVYEAVLPDPIDGFALGIVEKNFPAGEGTVVVENSARFAISAMTEHLKNRPTMGTRTSAVTFPWWENTARVAEYRSATLLLWEMILLGVSAVVLLSWIVLAWNPTGRLIKRGAIALRDGAEEKWNDLTRPRPKKEKKERKKK